MSDERVMDMIVWNGGQLAHRNADDQQSFECTGKTIRKGQLGSVKETLDSFEDTANESTRPITPQSPSLLRFWLIVRRCCFSRTGLGWPATVP